MHCARQREPFGPGQRDHVGQDHGERLVADDLAGAPHRMAEAERGLLAGEAGGAGARQLLPQKLGAGRLVAGAQRVLELVVDVEVILDHRLAAAGDEDEVLDARLLGLVDAMLQHRRVDDGEHLLGHALGGRQEPRAETGDGEHGLTNLLLCHLAGPELRFSRAAWQIGSRPSSVAAASSFSRLREKVARRSRVG